MDLGIRVPPCRPLGEVASFVRHVECVGFDFVGIVDSQLVARDAFMACLTAVNATRDLQIYTVVTNPFTRHSSVIAGAALTVYEVSAGRFGLVMGSGYSSASTIGRKPATIREMRDSIMEIRGLLNGDYVEYGDAASHLHFSNGTGPPILMAATGPRMLRLAGQLADGVLLGVGTHPRMLDEAKRLVREGATSVGRDANDIRYILPTRVVVNDDTALAQREARPLCAQWIVDKFRRTWLELARLDIEVEAVPEEILRLYPDIIHSDNWENAITATSFLSDETVAILCDVLGIIGSPSHCLERLLELEDQGIDEVYLMPLDSYTFPTSIVDTFSSDIMPRMGRRRR